MINRTLGLALIVCPMLTFSQGNETLDEITQDEIGGIFFFSLFLPLYFPVSFQFYRMYPKGPLYLDFECRQINYKL